MTCDDLRHLISLYIDDELDAEQRALVEEHLDSCEECSLLHRQLEQTVNLCASLEEIPVPDGFRQSVIDALHLKKHARAHSSRRGVFGVLHKIMGTGQRRALAVAAAALVLVIAVNSSWGTLPGLLGGLSAPSFMMKSEGVAPAAEPEMRAAYGLAQPAMPPPSPNEMMTKDMAPAGMGSGGIATSFDMTQVIERQVIRRAALSLEAEKGRFDEANRQLVMTVESFGGIILDSNTYTDYDQKRIAHYSIRVPQEKFTQLVAQIESLGKVESRSMGTQDVTEQYIDLQASITNKLRHEERLLEILAQAKTVDEILRIETELNRLRTEVDSLKGRLRYLENEVQMSSINVSIREWRQPVDPSKPNLLKDLWDALIRSTRNIVVFLGQIAPYLAVAWFVWFLVVTARKK